MEIKKIKELIEILEKSNLVELELKDKSNSIRLAKQNIGNNTIVPLTGQVPATIDSMHNSVISHQTTAAPQEEQETGLESINSPMVGTFYRASSPEAKPFVEVGDTIKAGTVLCIIEAMKTMNKIKSEKSGKIKAIPVEDGKPVEFGQKLFVIE